MVPVPVPTFEKVTVTVTVPVPLVKKLRFLRFRFRFHNTATSEVFRALTNVTMDQDGLLVNINVSDKVVDSLM
jgi:hypothetical protein